VGISAPPCLRRVRTLEEAGYIKGYHADIDARELGFEVQVFAMVRLNSQAEADLSAFGAIGASYCGTTPVVDGQLGDKLIRSFISSADGSAVISEVVRVRQPTRANEYLRQIDSAFSGCVQKGYFRSTGENRERVKITAGQPRPPINDYVSYTLRPETTGKFQRLVFFQLGDTVVALQFVGDTLPPRPLLERAQTAILERCAQQQFSSDQVVDGVRPLPSDTSITSAPAQPTASPPTTGP